jgi:hypothetical protein
MKLKRIFYIIPIFLMLGFLTLHAEKKKPPQLPLKELTNPNSPSYVPYPYPKTDFEIIEDFKYAVKILFGPKEGKHTSLARGYTDNSKLMLEILGENPNLEITQIIEVKDMIQTSPSHYYFLLQIVDKKGKVVAVGTLKDCGLMGGVAMCSEKVKFKPFKNEEQVRKIISDALGQVKINEMEMIFVYSTLDCDPFSPLWKVSTSAGIFFIDHFYDDIYSVENESPWTSGNAFLGPENRRMLILDSLNEKTIFLKKMKK